MKINLRRASLEVVKALLFAMALLFLADYFGWSLFTEAGGVPLQGAACSVGSAGLPVV